MTERGIRLLTDSFRIIRRLFRKAAPQDRSKRRGEAYSLPYVEPLNTARTPLADFFKSLLDDTIVLMEGPLYSNRWNEVLQLKL